MKNFDGQRNDFPGCTVTAIRTKVKFNPVMKTIKNPKFKTSMKYGFLFLVVSVLLLIYGCDTFEEDAISPENGVELSSENVHVLARSSSVIDFNKIVKTQQVVSVRITDEPDKGEFSNVDKNLFRYEPDEEFLEGTDVIGFNIVDTDEEVVKSGTIDITVSQDTEGFPCAIFALEDQAEVTNGQMVMVDVLANDLLCDVSPSTLELSIAKHPDNGEAVVQDQQIAFYPNPGFELTSLVYKINPSNEPDSASYAIVRIALGQAPCEFKANDDVYNYTLPLDGWGDVEVDILANDVLCLNGSAPDVVSIVEVAEFGDVAILENNKLVYWPNVQKGAYSDSMVYQVCKNQECDRATVTINLTLPQSPLVQGVDDSYDLNQYPQQQNYWMDVLGNDIYTNLSNVQISVVQAGKAGETWTSDKQLVYSQFNFQVETDTVIYRICEEIDGQQFCDEAEVKITTRQ